MTEVLGYLLLALIVTVLTIRDVRKLRDERRTVVEQKRSAWK